MAALPARHRSSAVPLAAVYAALVLYASLYPASGWRWPPGQSLEALLALPWPIWRDDFDFRANVAGYAPLGALLLVAARRSGWPTLPALALALAAPAALSYLCEVLQQFLPGRHPSLKDLAANALGAAGGVALALAGQAAGLDRRWHAVRTRWFARDSGGALALLALWPLALAFPTPAPLGLGQIGPQLHALATAAVEGVPWAAPLQELLAARGSEGGAVTGPGAAALAPLGEGAITTLGLLAPALLAFAAMAPGLRRVAVLAVLLALAGGGMSLSTLLNYGPGHAGSWLAPSTLPALLLAAAIALPLAAVGARLASALGLMALSGLVTAVAQAPPDPYFALNLQAWEQGRFVRFHGLAQWLGWLWPYAAMAWLLARLAARPGR